METLVQDVRARTDPLTIVEVSELLGFHEGALRN
jgi:hypothetical protein